jgi:dienelactone hydrolase
MDVLADFRRVPFAAFGRERPVYVEGEGPGVIIMHEVPGVSEEVLRFARKVAAAGFTVFLPHLFGVVGSRTNEVSRVRELAKLCISREWHVLAENRSSPITNWLRALARHVHEKLGGRGVGAVGMCVTGNFALTMTLDKAVVAPVLAHPSFPLPITRRKAAALHVTPETVENARRRSRDEGLKVLGVRFTGDVLFCREARFETLRRELGESFEAVEVPGRSAKPHMEPPHSVLTIGLVDREGEPTREAVDRVISFLRERLCD